MQAQKMDRKRAVGASEKQKSMLVEYLKKNTQLLSGKFSAKFTIKDAEAQWKELGDILNSIPGSQKDWKSWRKTWQDMRSRTKAKCGKNFRQRVGTGGGPYKEEPLTKTEEEIADLIKVVSVEGHSEVEESVVQNLNEIMLTTDENAEHQNQTPEPEPETLINKTPQFLSKRTNRRRTSLQFTAKAADDLKKIVSETEEMKHSYYKEKLKLLERIAVAKEKSSESKARIAESLAKIALILDSN